MSESDLVNKQAITVYLEGTRDALTSAQVNLDNGFYGVAVNRAYYAFFYTATALLLTLNITRSKHSGVMAAFREHFAKTNVFAVDHSRAYGDAFELRNVTDYELLGRADESEARTVVENARLFFERGQEYLKEQGYQ